MEFFLLIFSRDPFLRPFLNPSIRLIHPDPLIQPFIIPSMIHFYSFISWYVSGWRPCSRTCGKGVQTREIVCRQQVSRGQFNTLPDSQCTDAKPTDPATQDCNKIDCPAEKVPGDWSAVRNFSSVNMLCSLTFCVLC